MRKFSMAKWLIWYAGVGSRKSHLGKVSPENIDLIKLGAYKSKIQLRIPIHLW